ncbi:MAG: substrate-binding domain-containing protein [Pseudomonadota bacterium]
MDGETVAVVLPIALKEVFDDIAPKFTAATGHRFQTALMLNPEVPDYIAGGATWSIALSNPSYIKRIVDAGFCDGGSRPLGYSPLAFAMRGQSHAAPLERPAKIADFLRRAASVAVTGAGTSGAHFSKLAADLGISELMRGKLRLLPGGGPMAALKNGDVEVAALPLSNIAPVSGVFATAICPDDMGVHIEFSLCRCAGANAATRQFADWLRDPDVLSDLHGLGLRHGLSPA